MKNKAYLKRFMPYNFHKIRLMAQHGSAVWFAELPGDFRSWESPQTLPALFIGPFEHVERFRNLKFVLKIITNIQNTVLSSSEGKTFIHSTFQ